MIRFLVRPNNKGEISMLKMRLPVIHALSAGSVIVTQSVTYVGIWTNNNVDESKDRTSAYLRAFYTVYDMRVVAMVWPTVSLYVLWQRICPALGI